MPNFKIHKIYLLLLLLIIQNIFGWGNQYQLEKRKVLIDYKNEGFFNRITDLAVYNEFVIVADFKGNSVLEFKHELDTAEFVRFIGRKGQGPGDLQSPISISVNEDIISIKDQENISFFDMTGKYLARFKQFSYFISFVFANKLAYVASISNNDNLIDVYSMDGKLLNSFNKKYFKLDYSFNKSSPFVIENEIYNGDILSDGKYIYFINKRFGILQKFSLEGNLVIKKDLLSFLGEHEKRIVDENTRLFLKSEFDYIKEKRIPVNEIFRKTRIKGGNLYLMSINMFEMKDKSKIDIISIDTNKLNYNSRYQLIIDKRERLRNFDVQIIKDEPIFIANIISVDGDDEIYKLYPIKKSINE